MRSKNFRRNQEKLKDLRRRKLYRNHAINGRYELSNKEDPSLSMCAVYNAHNPVVRMVEWTAQKETIHPDKLTNDIGHWQEYPKNKGYGSKGYFLKKDIKKLRQLFKNKISKELDDDI